MALFLKLWLSDLHVTVIYEKTSTSVKDSCVLVARMKNDTFPTYCGDFCVCVCVCLDCVLSYLHICCIIYFVSVVVCCEICSNAPPKYRCWYCIMNYFNRLTFYYVVAVFTNTRVIGVPSLEVYVYIIVTYGLWVGLCCGGRGAGSFPFRKNKFLWFYHDFRYLTEPWVVHNSIQLFSGDSS